MLWHRLPIDEAHYDDALRLLGNSGVVVCLSKQDGVSASRIAVVPNRLPSACDNGSWPPFDDDETEYKLVAEFPLGCPPGIAERFAANAHRFGVTQRAWRVGAVVCNTKAGYRVLAGVLKPTENAGERRLIFAVLTQSANQDKAWELLRGARSFLHREQAERFVGLEFAIGFECKNPKCRELIVWNCGGSLVCDCCGSCVVEAAAPEVTTRPELSHGAAMDIPKALENAQLTHIRPVVISDALKLARMIATTCFGEKQRADGFTLIICDSNILLTPGECREIDSAGLLQSRTKYGYFRNDLDYRRFEVSIEECLCDPEKRRLIWDFV